MIFREDGEVGAFCSSGSDEVGCFGEVVGGVKGLREEENQLVGCERRYRCDFEDLGMELDDGDLVAGCHSEGPLQ